LNYAIVAHLSAGAQLCCPVRGLANLAWELAHQSEANEEAIYE